MRRWLRLGPLLGIALAAPWSSPLAQQAQPAAIPVGTIAAEKRAIGRTADFVGRIEAMNRVEVRARITGFLEEVLFRDGETVKQGTPLFRIEKEPFEAAVQQARGALERAEGSLQNATGQRQRAEDLLRTNAGSVAVRDQRVAEEKAAQGDATTAAANLKTAEINLGYTQISSPIAGRIGRTRLTKGNVVSPESGALAQIVSQDRMSPSRSASANSSRSTPTRCRAAEPLPRSACASPTARPMPNRGRSTSSTSRSSARPTPCSSAPPCPIRPES
jgi:membrane fusion protein (multidrug efflux system)